MIRRARSDDEPAIRRLQSHLREPSRGLVAYAIRAGTAYVSVVGDRPVGYLLATGGGHVAELVVAPDARREGRGGRLLARAIADADGRVTLFVHPDNEPAKSLYRQRGFRAVDRRPEFYEDADAIVMARESTRS